MNYPGTTADEALLLLEASQRLLGLNLSSGSAYASLSESQKTAVATAILASGPFESVAAIRLVFEDEIANAENS